MEVRQISVFLENKIGRLAEITEILGDKKINIRALSIADTAEFGILRMIVDTPQKAYQALEERGFTVSRTEVVVVEVKESRVAWHKLWLFWEKQALMWNTSMLS